MKNTKHADGRHHHSRRAENHSAHNHNHSEHHHRDGHSNHHHSEHIDDDRRHRGHHGHGGRHGHHQRRHRLFDYGELRLLVLVMIETQPRHGYELIKEIEERFEGRYTPSPGVIYPTLTWLDDMGYALQHSEGSKKQYLITDEGRAFLTANRDAADELLTRRPPSPILDENHEGTDRHNLRELMGSLRHLIKEKLSQDRTNDKLHEDMATIVQKAYNDIKAL